MPWFKLDSSLVGGMVPLRGAPLAVFVTAGLSADPDGTTQLSLAELARITGYSRRSVVSAVGLLQRSGLLTTVTVSSGRRSVRQVHRCLCFGKETPQPAPLAELWQAVTPEDEGQLLPFSPADPPPEAD